MFALRFKDFCRRKEWEKALNERTKESSVLKNPFRVEFKTMRVGGDCVCVFDIRPLWFNFSVFGWLAGFGSLLVVGVSWFLIPSIIIGSLGFFWSPLFMRWGIRRGLRRYDCEGSIKKVRLRDVVRLTLFEKKVVE